MRIPFPLAASTATSLLVASITGPASAQPDTATTAPRFGT